MTAGGVVEAIELMPSKQEALSSNPELPKKKKKRRMITTLIG
jgi:hypothetical protein